MGMRLLSERRVVTTVLNIMKTSKEIAEYLKVNVRFVTRLIRSGKLKARKIGNMWFIEKEDLLNYVRSL